MIQIIPAIDLIQGACVRLTKGDYATSRVYHSDPVAAALRFADAGLKRLHLVDLEGAKAGQIMQAAVLERIAAETTLAIDFGGGIRSKRDLDLALCAGALQVNVGSLAVKEPELFFSWIKEYGPFRVILAADVRGEFIATGGWLEDTAVKLEDYLEKFSIQGGLHVACTDIERDGALSGPALDLYRRLHERFPLLKLTASGGVSTVDDIHALNEIGIDAVIIGKALYEGTISLADLREFL